MEWIEGLAGQVVGLDTAPLIYFIERHRKYHDLVRRFFLGMDRGEFRVVTSVVTLSEVLVQPLRAQRADLVVQYRDLLFNIEGLTTVPVSPDIAEDAAGLRARHKIRTPDAIQLATAVREGAAFFFTNDLRLPSLPTLKVLTLEQLTDGG